MKEGLGRWARARFGSALWMLVAFGCTPLIYPINYRSIRGAVGHPLKAPSRVQCADPQVLTDAMVVGGELPPGVTLEPDGLVSGIPTTAGRWHAMIRLARVQCGSEVFPGERTELNFEIAEPSTP